MANTDCPLYRLHLSTTRLQKDDSSIGKNKLNIKPSLSMTEGEKRLISWYPMVNEKYHPLPRQWSNNKNEKCSYLGLSENQMRVFYKGSLNKNQDNKNAASVRTTHPIPQSCGIYYYEVKIISKGRDGYMGIGLTAVEKMENKLPGWDKNSYGYHGDDGDSFCSSGQGQSYGPTFTTGDIIGCCVNFINNTCFFTKNGHNLGIAFKNMARKLYPTVGLQTPGEIIEANFGEEPFVFDFAEYLEGWKYKMKTKITNYVSDSYKGDTEVDMQKMVLSYLSFQGYTSTLEAFSKETSLPVQEDIVSIKNRQKIQHLVLMGRISEAISLIHKYFPALLETNPELHFRLKCRQFIEMIGGVDTDYYPPHRSSHPSSPPMHDGSPLTLSCRSSAQPLSPSSSSNRPNIVSNGSNSNNTNGHFVDNDDDDNAMDTSEINNNVTSNNNTDNLSNGTSQQNGTNHQLANNIHNHLNYSNNNANKISSESQRHSNKRSRNKNRNKNKNRHSITNNTNNTLNNNLFKEDSSNPIFNSEINNTTSSFVNLNNNNGINESSFVKNDNECSEDSVTLSTNNDNKENDMLQMNNVKNIVKFGQNLHLMIEQLKKDNIGNEENEIALRDAFSLLAYTDPWQSPMNYQLKASEREALSNQLNSAILENIGQASQSSFHMAVQHQRHLLALMASVGLATSAFASFSLL